MLVGVAAGGREAVAGQIGLRRMGMARQLKPSASPAEPSYMNRTTIIVLVMSAALAAVAIVIGTYVLTS